MPLAPIALTLASFALPLASFGGSVAERAARPTPPLLEGAEPNIRWMATVVVILLVCIIGTGYGVKRVVGTSWRGRALRRSLGVLDVLPLGGRRQMVVVRCYDRTFALGVGDKEVSLLAELDSEFVAADVAENAVNSRAVPGPADFKALVKKAWLRPAVPPRPTPAPSTAAAPTAATRRASRDTIVPTPAGALAAHTTLDAALDRGEVVA